MLSAHDNILLTKDARESSTNSHERAHSEIVHMLYDKSKEGNEESDNRFHSYCRSNNNDVRVNYETRYKKSNFAKSYTGHVHQLPFHKSTADYGVKRTLPRMYNLTNTKNKRDDNINNNKNNNIFSSTSNLWRLHIRTSPSFNIQQTAPAPYLLACAEINASLPDWNKQFQEAWELPSHSKELATIRMKRILRVEHKFAEAATNTVMQIVNLDDDGPIELPRCTQCYRVNNIFYRVLPDSRSGRNYIASLRNILSSSSTLLTVPLTVMFHYRGMPILAQALIPLARQPICLTTATTTRQPSCVEQSSQATTHSTGPVRNKPLLLKRQRPQINEQDAEIKMEEQNMADADFNIETNNETLQCNHEKIEHVLDAKHNSDVKSDEKNNANNVNERLGLHEECESEVMYGEEVQEEKNVDKEKRNARHEGNEVVCTTTDTGANDENIKSCHVTKTDNTRINVNVNKDYNDYDNYHGKAANENVNRAIEVNREYVLSRREIMAELQFISNTLRKKFVNENVEIYEALDGRYYVTNSNTTLTPLFNDPHETIMKRHEHLRVCERVSVNCDDVLQRLRSEVVLTDIIATCEMEINTTRAASVESPPRENEAGKLSEISSTSTIVQCNILHKLCHVLHMHGINLCLLKQVIRAVQSSAGKLCSSEQAKEVTEFIACEMISRTIKQEFYIEIQGKRLAYDDTALMQSLSKHLGNAFVSDRIFRCTFLDFLARKYGIVDNDNDLIELITNKRAKWQDCVITRVCKLLNVCIHKKLQVSVDWTPLLSKSVIPNLIKPNTLKHLVEMYKKVKTEDAHWIAFATPLRAKVALWNHEYALAINLLKETTKNFVFNKNRSASMEKDNRKFTQINNEELKYSEEKYIDSEKEKSEISHFNALQAEINLILAQLNSDKENDVLTGVNLIETLMQKCMELKSNRTTSRIYTEMGNALMHAAIRISDQNNINFYRMLIDKAKCCFESSLEIMPEGLKNDKSS